MSATHVLLAIEASQRRGCVAVRDRDRHEPREKDDDGDRDATERRLSVEVSQLFQRGCTGRSMPV